MKNDVLEVQIRGILPANSGCALFVGNDKKVFVINVEPHGPYTNDIEFMQNLFKHFESEYLQCNFDTGNTFIAGHKPLDYLKALRKYVCHCHIKDVSPALAAAVRFAEDRLSDNGRVFVRYSGTEPLLRIMVEAEEDSLARETAEGIAACRRDGGRVFAVGTTSVRTLEANFQEHGRIQPGRGRAEIYIQPGHEFRAVDVLVTNFHLPGTSMLVLTCGFGGKDLVLSAYQYAVRERFRFLSLGDAMMII